MESIAEVRSARDLVFASSTSRYNVESHHIPLAPVAKLNILQDLWCWKFVISLRHHPRIGCSLVVRQGECTDMKVGISWVKCLRKSTGCSTHRKTVAMLPLTTRIHREAASLYVSTAAPVALATLSNLMTI